MLGKGLWTEMCPREVGLKKRRGRRGKEVWIAEGWAPGPVRWLDGWMGRVWRLGWMRGSVVVWIYVLV
jgi:hypothetical protein